MQNSKFQTLHPEKGKKNSPVAVKEYKLFKTAIIKVLKKGELTHTELETQVGDILNNSFTGNVHWHVMTVKLDLEARKTIQRIKSSPAKYKLV